MVDGQQKELCELKDLSKEVFEFDGKVLLLCSTKMCGPCRVMTNTLTKALDSISGMKVMKSYVDDNPNVGRELSIFSVPTLIIFHSGKEVKRHVGSYNSPKDLLTWIADSGSSR